MIFRQLFDAPTWTFTYLLADEDTREAILIDTVFEQHLRDVALLRELGLTLRYTLDTHVHADHVTGAWLMRSALGSRIAMSRASGAEGADLLLDPGDRVQAGSVALDVRATPGHTDGCVTYVLADRTMAFTGDALLIRGAGRTDFQQGSAERLFDSVRTQVLSLPDDCLLYPAHDYDGRTVTTVAEERAFNPRLGDQVGKRDFVGYMDNLGLPHPKRLDVALPANLRCGRPLEGDEVPAAPTWGPVVRTYAGVLEIEPAWVHEHQDEVTLVDVREAAEVSATPLGVIAGARSVPLSALRERLDELPRDRPLITLCPAGARSAHAALLLERAGFERVANLAGGLMRWRALGFPMAAAAAERGT
ncbi:MAG: MBL fold metallo-hydrolase [Deltaproteobacteria bacterium]|nr:MBL fold metallo-hydrolase [Deltaproteobacteria bacterium]